MRLAIYCELQNECMPIDYRRKIVSFFKFSLLNYDKKLYEHMYGTGKTNQKEFCFSIYFGEAKIEGERMITRNKSLIINLSISNLELGINMYNSLVKQQWKFYELSTYNKIRITNISLKEEKVIIRKRVEFKTLSPIVIRDHNKCNGKDWYLTFEDNNYEKILKRNLKRELTNKFHRSIEEDINNLKITNLNMRKIIVKSYSINVACSIGNFIVEGEQYLLNYFYKAGLGSKKNLGFSLLDIVE